MKETPPFLHVFAVVLAAGLFSTSAHAASRPNIVLILADDMGHADAGFMGAKDIKTPNLDKLAASGVIFTQGYANHIYCAPSRAGLMAGRYQQRFGFESNPNDDPNNPYLGIDPGEKLFPARLQEAGYVTGLIGKWHLGTGPEFQPNKRGFDYFYGFVGGGHDYFDIDLTRQDEAYLGTLMRNKMPATFDGYLTTALSRDAVQFIEAHKDEPFFLFLSYNAPHGPLQAPKEDIARYSHIKNEKRRVYAAMVDVMDRGIGEVIEALEKNDLRENTLIFFLSDNGGPDEAANDNPWWWNGSSNAPFRAGKAFMYEGGMHVPFVASWPAKIPAGKMFDAPVISLDIGRTAVEHAGGDAQAGKPLEGVDLVPYVRGEKTGVPHDAVYFRDSDGARSAIVMADGWKLVQNSPNGKFELYNLRDDISESDDLSSKYPERVEALRQKWEVWNEDNVAQRFLNSPEYVRRKEQFYIDSIPEDARAEGFGPKPGEE